MISSASPCISCGIPTADLDDSLHTCDPVHVALTQARRDAWLDGYNFALRNQGDEAVEADRSRLSAG